jgi:TRAP-type C4-dicarboxylate transport system permease small subunit
MWVKVSDTLDRVYLVGVYGAALLLVTLCLLVLYSIVARLLGLYAGGATDFSGYVMATSTFMALAYTFRSHGHIRVALIIQNFVGARRRAIEVFCLAFMSWVTGFMAFYMVRLTLDSYEWQERSEGADAILMWIPQTPVAVGSILFFIAVFHTFLLSIFQYDLVNPETNKDEGPNEV